MPSELSVEALQRLIDLEEASFGQPLDGESENIPMMTSLRSPTTRTLMAILDHHRRSDHLKESWSIASAEERAIQEVAEEAEELLAEPLIKAFKNGLQAITEQIRDVRTREQSRSNGDREGIESNNDFEVVSRIQFMCPRNEAGTMIGMTSTASAIMASRNSRTSQQQPEDKTFSTPTESRQRLRDLMAKQSEDLKQLATSRGEYKNLLVTYQRWQQKRTELFDELLKTET